MKWQFSLLPLAFLSTVLAAPTGNPSVITHEMTEVNARDAEQPDIIATKRDFDDDDVETIAWGHGHWEYGGKAKRDDSGAYAKQ